MTGNLYSQFDTIRGSIEINDSLFNAAISPYSMTNVIGHFVNTYDLNEVQAINEMLKIENDTLKYLISYGGGGSGRYLLKLVSDGKIYKDNNNIEYYKIKLYFVDNDLAKAMRYIYLEYDLRNLKGKKIKYANFSDYIKDE
jgi:hypothetical protein